LHKRIKGEEIEAEVAPETKQIDQSSKSFFTESKQLRFDPAQEVFFKKVTFSTGSL